MTGNATSEVSVHSQPRDADICSHYIEILPEDEEELWAAKLEPLMNVGADKDICSHRIDILPEDEEEIWVAETKPSIPRKIAIHASSVQGLGSPHMKDQQEMSHDTSPRIAIHPSPVQGLDSPHMKDQQSMSQVTSPRIAVHASPVRDLDSPHMKAQQAMSHITSPRFAVHPSPVQDLDLPHLKDQQGMSHATSMHPVMSADAGRPGSAPITTSAQQEETPCLAPDMTSVEEPPLAAPPR